MRMSLYSRVDMHAVCGRSTAHIHSAVSVRGTYMRSHVCDSPSLADGPLRTSIMHFVSTIALRMMYSRPSELTPSMSSAFAAVARSIDAFAWRSLKCRNSATPPTWRQIAGSFMGPFPIKQAFDDVSRSDLNTCGRNVFCTLKSCRRCRKCNCRSSSLDVCGLLSEEVTRQREGLYSRCHSYCWICA